MPDSDLQGIVQRMIDAGEPEENIATVIRHAQATTPTLTEMMANQPTTDTGAALPATGLRRIAENPLLQGAAHPQSAGDLLNLIIPSGLAEGAGAAMNLARGAWRGAKDATGLMKLPGAMFRGAAEEAFRPDATSAIRDFWGGAKPTGPPTSPIQLNTAPDAWERLRATEAPPNPTATSLATPPSGGLSPAERAMLRKQGYAPEVIDRIATQAGGPARAASQPTSLVKSRVMSNLPQEPTGTGIEWESGAEPGTPDARNAELLHRYEGELQGRYLNRLADPKASLVPPMVLTPALVRQWLMNRLRGTPGESATQ